MGAIRLALLVAVACTGCHSVVTHATIPVEHDVTTLSVEPFWTNEAGEDLVVSGLVVELWHRDQLFQTQTSAIDTHLVFSGLEPGSYKLRVVASEREVLAHRLDLPRGQSVLVRIDLRALEGVAPTGASDPPASAGSSGLDDFLEGLGEFFYYVGMGILIVGVAGLAVAACQPQLVVVLVAVLN